MRAFNSPTFIQFSSKVTDTVTTSFFLFPNKSSLKVYLPVKLVSFMPTADFNYSIEVEKSNTTAPDKNFQIEPTYVYKKGQVQDSAFVTLKKSAELDTKAFYVSVVITGGKDVLPGQTENIRQIIKFSNMVSKPLWWDAEMDEFYLGQYSDRKYSKFIEVVGFGNLNDYSPAEQRKYMLQFKYYLIQMKDNGTPVLEEDGKDMLSTIPLIG